MAFLLPRWGRVGRPSNGRSICWSTCCRSAGLMAHRSADPLDRIARIARAQAGEVLPCRGARPADVLEIGRSIDEFWSVGVKNWSIFKDLAHSAPILGSPPLAQAHCAARHPVASCPKALRSASSGGFLPERTTQRVIRWRCRYPHSPGASCPPLRRGLLASWPRLHGERSHPGQLCLDRAAALHGERAKRAKVIHRDTAGRAIGPLVAGLLAEQAA